jgi:type I restriction enzyme M protein
MGIVADQKRLLPEYLHTYLLGIDLSQWASDAQPPSMRKTVVEDHMIPLPTLEAQQAIGADIEAEQRLIAANRELIARFEKKIESTLARVWDERESEQVGV